MSIVNIEALKSQGCQLWWTGQYASSGTTQGFPIIPSGVTVTPNGTFTSVKGKDGRNYWKFNGSTNLISLSDNNAWPLFLDDFTIIDWLKIDSIAANRVICGQYADANNYWVLQWTTSNVVVLTGMINGVATFGYSCPLIPTIGNWYHISVQRVGAVCVIYLNCVSQTVTVITTFTAIATDVAAALTIGGSNGAYMLGSIKDFQMFEKALTQDQVSALMQETYIY